MNRSASSGTQAHCRVRSLSFFMLAAASLAPAGSLRSQTRVELPGQDKMISMEAEEVYRVGPMAGEEWETFSRVTGVAFDKEGNLFHLGADSFRVVKVGLGGSLLAEMGGEGGGPGEAWWICGGLQGGWSFPGPSQSICFPWRVKSGSIPSTGIGIQP